MTHLSRASATCVIALLLTCVGSCEHHTSIGDQLPDASPDCGLPSDASSPTTLELDLQTTPAAVFVPITIGSSRFEALVDTGSTGLRVVDDLVAASDWMNTGDTTQITFGFGGQVQGPVELATVTLGAGEMQVSTLAPIRVQAIATITCAAGVSSCPTKASFAYGRGAIIGIGTRAATDGVDNPLRAITDGSYALSLPVYPTDGATSGAATLLLDPATVERTRYDFVHLPTAAGAFDDRSLQISLNGTAQPLGIADSGAVDATMPTVPSGIATDPTTGVYAPGSALELAVELDSTALVWSFVVGATPVGGLDLVRSKFPSGTTQPRSNLGTMVFFRWDVFYDLRAGMIGFAAKN